MVILILYQSFLLVIALLYTPTCDPLISRFPKFHHCKVFCISFGHVRILLTPTHLRWFNSAFAVILPSHCLEGIWDIVLGGGDIFPYVALSLILACRRKVEQDARLASDVRRIVEEYPNIDAIAATAIELWETPILNNKAYVNKVRMSLYVSSSLKHFVIPRIKMAQSTVINKSVSYQS
jgi:hypothetical protein